MAPSCMKTSCDQSSLIKYTKHAPSRSSSLLLKDYLRDDLSSCSSSGFKSLPRRQCCTTVGFSRDPQLHRKRRNTLPQRQSKSSSTMSLALQRASKVVINAIKSLPLNQKSEKGGSGSGSGSGKGGVGLSRSFSRKLLSRSFWRKAAAGSKEDAATMRYSFRELLLEDRDYHKTTSLKQETTTLAAPSVITTTSSGSGSNNDSWGESEFTFSSSTTSSDENDAPRHKIEGITTMDWPCEKEQFSPVSVLDFPFEDEQVIKSHFNSTHKRRHFRSVSSLKPVVLEKRIARSELEDAPHNNNHSANQCSNNVEDNSRDLVSFMKTSIPYNCLVFEAENLLFDYFKQRIGESNNEIDHSKKFQLCKVAEDWIRGKPKDLYLGWEVKEGRGVYISEMDKCTEEWKNSDGETQQLVLDMENEVFASLVSEVVLDLAT